jgi:hypothetical protein
MSDGERGRRLERHLIDAGRSVQSQGNVADDVMRRIRAGEGAPTPERRRMRLRVLVPVAALVAGSGCMAVPDLRDAALSLFRTNGVEVTRSSRPPAGTGSQRLFNVGSQTDLANVERATSGAVLVPPGLGAPDAVFRRGSLVTLVWGDPTNSSGPYWLVMEVTEKSRALLSKTVRTASQVRRITVHGASGVWVRGPQELAYIGDDGRARAEDSRTAGNSLIWTRDGVTVRIETDRDLRAALPVARSMR